MIGDHLCTGLKGVGLSLMESKQRYTAPFGLGTMDKLLHYYAVSYSPHCAKPIVLLYFIVLFCMALAVNLLHAWVTPKMASHHL